MGNTCVHTFDYLVNEVKKAEFSIAYAKKNPEETINATIKKLAELGSTGGIDESLSFEEIQELATMLSTLAGTEPPIITTSELAAKLLPKKEFGNSKEPGVNGSLDSPTEDYEDSRRNFVDFIEKVYLNSAVTSTLLRFFQNETISKIMVDLEENLEILGNSETLNDELRKLLGSLYNKIIEYLDIVDPHHGLSRTLYVNEQCTLDALTEYFKTSLNREINLFYEHRHVPLTTLADWRNKAAIQEKGFKEKLLAYNSYFILQHFDSMLTKVFGSLILYKESEKNKMVYPKDKYKYNFLDDHNRIVSWQQEDLQQKGAFDLIPKSLQTFIESCELLNFDLAEPSGTGQYLTKDHITYMISKIKNDFRSKKYNDRQLVYIRSSKEKPLREKSIEEIKKKMKFTNIVDEAKLTEEDRTQLAILLWSDTVPEVEGIKSLTLRDVVNSVRLSPALTIKLIFDLRNAHKAEFPTDLEKRIFQNIKHYFFNEDKSLYSSSKRMYKLLALLFDTTSILTYTLYKIDRDGSLSLIRLNPSRLSQEANFLKSKINSRFVAGECDNILQTYNVNSIYKDEPSGQTRLITFEINDWGRKIQFRYNPKVTSAKSRWIMITTDRNNNTVEFNPATLTADNLVNLSDADFNMICKLAKDVIGIDLYQNKELRTAYLNQFKSYHAAALNLINTVVPILANIKIFKEKPTDVEFIKNISLLRPDTIYTYRIKQGNLYINSKFYLTDSDKPYTTLNEKKEVVPDIETIKSKMKGWVAHHLTKEQIKSLIEQGAEIGKARENKFLDDIADWYPDKFALRVSTKYEGVDIISDTVLKNLEPIVNANTLINGSTFKTLVRTAENTNITVGQSSILFTERFNRLEKYNTELIPMHVVYDELAKGLEGYEISREGDNAGTPKQHKDFNFKENFWSSFVVDFFLPMYGKAKWNPRFTESVNSDKNSVPKIIIEAAKILQAADTSEKIHETLGDAYRLCFNNMVSDFLKIQDYYNQKNFTNIKLSPENNFKEFNDWCRKPINNIDPLQQLNEMVLFYNTNHRDEPIAIAENIHYHINRKTNNLEMVFSFIEALGRYTIITDSEYTKRVNDLTKKIEDSRTTKQESVRLTNLLEAYKNSYKSDTDSTTSNVYSWNKKIIDIINSENTKSQLGLAYNEFRNRFIDGETSESLIKAYLGGDSHKKPYNEFIHNSNLQFISDLLKNDVTIDLKDAESKETQLYTYIKNVIRKLPEYSSKLDATESNLKNVLEEYSKLWLTYSQDLLTEDFKILPRHCDRMALGVLEYYNEVTGKYEILLEEQTINVLVKDKVVLKKVKTPVKIASREDLAFIKAYDKNGKEVKYYDSSYDLSKLNLNYKGKRVRIKINPLLELYNLNSFYWTTLSTFATAGSHIWNDAKGGTNTLNEECLKWFDNNKRNVIMTATKLQFELGDVWGVPKEVNIAVLDDITATCSGIMGDTPTVKPYDGATFVNALMYYWENNSLNNQITGTTKKPIYEFYDGRLMAGGFIKTATFALTNENIRNSAWAARAMWKTTNIKWEYQKGKEIDDEHAIDLTLGLELGCIGLLATTVNGKDYRGPMYFENINGKRYVKEIIGFRSLGKNRYKITTRLIDPRTNEYVKRNGSIWDSYETSITDNYTFWKVLGKYNSCSYNSETNEYYYSENSIKTVAEWAAKIKFRHNNGAYELVKFGTKTLTPHEDQKLNPDKFSFLKDSYYLRDDRVIYCPLKEANIHYLVTKGAIKKYAANINSNEEYFSDRSLNFFKIKMLEAGIQLDPTHEADLSVVSMMTQVISALAERGYTHEQAQEVYAALGELTSLAIADGMKAFDTYFTTKDRADLQTVVSKLIVEEFAFSLTQHKGSNLAQAITQRLIDEGIRGEKLQFNKTQGVFPFSDPSMFAILQTTITSALNKKAIKALLFGSLAVLNPSHEIHLRYGNKSLSELNTFEDIEQELKFLPTLESLSLAEIGRTYQVILDKEELERDIAEQEQFSSLYPGVEYDNSLHGQIIQLKDSDYYYLWKHKLAGKKYTLKEIIYTLGETFVGSLENIKAQILKTNNLFNFFTINTATGSKLVRIDDVSELDSLNKAGNSIRSVQKLNLYGRNLGSYNIHLETTKGKFNRYDLKVVQDSVLYDISNRIKEYLKQIGYNSIIPIENSIEWTNLTRALKIHPEKQELYKYVAQAFRYVDTTMPSKVEREKQLLKELLQISKYQTINVYDNNNQLTTATVGGYSVKKFEAILPRIYATLFGLRKGDSVALVVQDKYFFFDRILENYLGKKSPDPRTYDLCFKRSDGKHIYVYYAANPKDFDFLNLHKISIDKYTDDNGTYRMDPYKSRKKLHPLASHADLVFYDDANESEVIVTNDLSFYINNLSYLNIEVSRKTSNAEAITTAIKTNENNYSCKQLQKRIDNAGGIQKFIENLTLLHNLISEYTSKKKTRSNKEISEAIKALDKTFYNYIYNLSQKQRTAFKQSLNFTVARIPAQGMQSFMAMEIVGFNDSDVNDCYVSAEQIRLQGSDYDVDKATFMGFAFSKSGEFVKWSPFFLANTLSDLVTSMNELPYPTGRTIKIESGYRNSIDYSKYEKLFVTKEVDTEENSEENFNNQTETRKLLKNFRSKAEQELLAELIREINELVKLEVNKDNKITEVTLTYNYATDEETIKAILAIVNKHNLYIRKVAKEEKENLLKNFVSYKTYQISLNPVNSLAGETPVDESALPFKDLADISPFGNKPEYSRPGNSAILFSALLLNLGGKDVISIAASLGLKTLHAITLAYNNSIANSDNIENLWFDVELANAKDSTNPTRYHFLADAYLDIKTELSEEELRLELITRLTNKGLTLTLADILWKAYLNHSEWAGSNESGILTLATDNAKELRLDRLNAGKDLAGLYLYGILIGIPREDIFKIMTSQTAQVLARITKGNLFVDPHRFLDSMKQAIKFLNKDPNIPKTIIAKDKIERIEKLTPIDGIKYDGSNLKTFLVLEGSTLKDTVVELTRRGQFKTYLKRLKLIQERILTNEAAVKLKDRLYEEWRVKNNTGLSYDEKQNRDTILRLITYATSVHEIIDSHLKDGEATISGDPWADLKNISTLFKGLEELLNINQLLSLNLGQKTKTEEVYNFYERFSNILYDKLRAEGKINKNKKLTKEALQLFQHQLPELLENNGRVDFDKFIRDPEYQKGVIRFYDKVKTSINPYWVITSVPHFKLYLAAAHTIYVESRISIKNRMMIDLVVPHIKEVYKPTNVEIGKYYKRALNFIDGLMSNAFLREDKLIEIPAGNKIYKKDNEYKQLTYQIFDHPVLIELGTREGNETFRAWMNLSVIPNLVREGKLYDQSVKIRPPHLTINGPFGNKFLADLTPTYSNNTVNRNSIMVYTLPIDMIPKADAEIDLLSKYTIDFLKLSKVRYKVSDQVSYSLTDLFFYYNLINFLNKGGAASLTALFEPFIRTGESSASNRYATFVANLDTEYEFKMGRDYTEEMLNIALAPDKMEISMNEAERREIPYYFYPNKYTLKLEIHEYNPKAIANRRQKLLELDIDPELMPKKTALEIRGFQLAEGSIINIPSYETKELNISLETESKTPVVLDFITADVTLNTKENIPKSLTISGVKVDNNLSDKLKKDIVISGKELSSYVKVTRDENGKYGFKVNPISLLTKLQTLRRAC